MSAGCTSSSPSAKDGGERATGLKIAIVGVCGSGKSTLARGLTARGYHARQISQEHSHVPELWRRFWEPDRLVFLDVSDEEVSRRLGRDTHAATLANQRRRLVGARLKCDLYLHTDVLTSGQVLATILAGLAESETSSPFRQ